jgi:hypothetical protein
MIEHMPAVMEQMNALIHIRDNLLDHNREFSITDAIRDPYIAYIYSTRKNLLDDVRRLVKEGTLNQITQFKFKFPE